MNSGADHPHFSKDTGHRRWKRQPGGGSVRSGGAPGMKSGAASLLNRGTLARSFPVNGCLGLKKTPSAGDATYNLYTKYDPHNVALLTPRVKTYVVIVLDTSDGYLD